jgi:hypothetical protein
MSWKSRNLQREATGGIESKHPGYLLAQDVYYVGNFQGFGGGLSTDFY